MTKIHTENISIQSSDGESSLAVRRYSQGSPRLHFIIIHGAVEHSERHQDLVNFWLKRYPDVIVTVFDHLGHGKSGGTHAYVPSFKTYVEDFIKVESLKSEMFSSEMKTFICAHSMGGLVTLTRLLDPWFPAPPPYAGIIFSSPCIKPQVLLKHFSVPLLQKLDLITPKLHLPLIYKGAELTRDSTRANDFDIDPLIPKFISVRMGLEIIRASEKIRKLPYYLKYPSLFLVAGEDKIVDPESTLLFTHGVDKQLAEVIQYPYHYHELWNEIDRQNIFETMKKWVDGKLKESR